MKGSVAAALATTKIGGKDGAAPLFRLACMKAMSSASLKFSKGEEQTLLRPSEISALAADKKSQIALQGESVLIKVREIADELGLRSDTAAWSTTIGIADVRVVHFVLNKADEPRGSFTNITQQLRMLEE